MSAVANAIPLTWCRVTVPWSGAAIAEIHAPEPVLPVAGVVSVAMGDLLVSGALARGGEFTGQWKGYTVAGRNGWSKTISPKGYQSPFGVLNTEVILDAARECGELPPVVTVPSMMGGYYTRRGDKPASQVFDKLPPFCDWWVDLATGITQVNARAPLVVSAPFEILDPVDLSKGRLTIATDNPGQFLPNATFIDPQAGVFTVNAAVWTSELNSFRGEIWVM